MVPMAALAAIRFLKSDSPLGMLKAWLGVGEGAGSGLGLGIRVRD